MSNHSENGIATAIRVCAFIVITAGLLGFLFNLDGHSATLMIGVAFLASGIISGLLLLGFSEVIYLLQDLNSSGYRRSESAQIMSKTDTPAKSSAQSNVTPQQQETVHEFSADGFDKAGFLNHISSLERVSEMYNSVSQIAASNPNLFSQNILNQLQDCVDIERMYGKGSGKQSFLTKLRAYFG